MVYMVVYKPKDKSLDVQRQSQKYLRGEQNPQLRHHYRQGPLSDHL